MKEQNLKFDVPGQSKDLIRVCETAYHDAVERVGNQICERPGLRFLTLAGPTCSGKTTTAQILERHLERREKRLEVISLDDFFRDSSHVDRSTAARSGGEVDYDSPDALDIPCLEESLKRICNMQTAELPVFDFRTGKRAGSRTFDPASCDLILFEGIQAVFPSVFALFAPEQTYRIYISVAKTLRVNGTVFTPRTVRLIRRIVRDYKFRCAEPEFTLYLWKSVTDNEDKYILPNAHRADICIDSLLAYEINAVRDILLPILAHVGEDSPYSETARELERAVEPLASLDCSLIPDDSLFREFIGPRM